MQMPNLSGQICVTHFQRKPCACQFSMERVFATIRGALPQDIVVRQRCCKFESHGLMRRILNIADAHFRQADVNHITGDVNYVALGLTKRKTILTIHDCVSLHFTKGLTYTRILWLWYQFPARRVAAITVISDFVRTELLRYVKCDPQMVHVIPNPVSPEFVPWPKGFNAECPVLLQVGAAEHNKNIVRLAEALRGVRCRLDIIGAITQRQRQALEDNSVVCRYYSDLSDQEVVRRYRECDIVLFASTYEGFGLPIIEGNATGRPVVTSSIGPMPEVAAAAACLVDPFDPSSIRAGILRVIEDAAYRTHLIAEGFENVKRFRADIIAAQYARLYRAVFAVAERRDRARTGAGNTRIEV